MKSYKDIRLWLLMIVAAAGMLWHAIFADASVVGGIRISVSPQTLVDGEAVYLGNIAQVEGDDPQLVEKLKNVLIGRSPLPGNILEFEAADLSRRLRQNGFDPDELVLRIPPKIAVERSLILMSQAKIKKLVADYITQHLLAGLPDARIKDIRTSEEIELPAGHVTYTVNPTRNAGSMGKLPFTINFDVNGKLFKRVWATATLEVFSDVVVTQKPLGRYKPITEDDIDVQKMDLANLPADVVTDPAAVLGKRTRRAIGAQTALRPHLVEFPPLVKRGDVVVIIAETEGLKITALGEVKKKGRIGERIPVVNFDSKKILYARVVDANTVKIEF